MVGQRVGGVTHLAQPNWPAVMCSDMAPVILAPDILRRQAHPNGDVVTIGQPEGSNHES